MEQIDILIIGAGPTGLNCGIAAKKAGLSHLIIEKGVLVNSIYHFPTNMTFFSTSLLLEIGAIPFISHLEKPTRKEALEYYRRVFLNWDLNVHLYEEVLKMEPKGDGSYLIRSNKGNYLAKNVVVATGFYDKARMLNIPGESLSKVRHYYDDPFPYVGQELLVIGAANSACDAALETYYKGAKVTMAIRESEIYPKVKYWIRPNIENRIKEGSIKAYFNTLVREIKEKEVLLEGPDGTFSIPNDFVLAMTGYQPNYDLFAQLNIPISEDELKLPIHNEQTLETLLPNVYVAGVICAGMRTNKLFIENTRDHGERIINNIQRKGALVRSGT